MFGDSYDAQGLIRFMIEGVSQFWKAAVLWTVPHVAAFCETAWRLIQVCSDEASWKCFVKEIYLIDSWGGVYLTGEIRNYWKNDSLTFNHNIYLYILWLLSFYLSSESCEGFAVNTWVWLLTELFSCRELKCSHLIYCMKCAMWSFSICCWLK